MTQIYCGNNGADSGLRNGSYRLGNRYTCMRKGIMIGLYMPYDPKYLEEYCPIDKTKIYCGTQTKIPLGYDNFGSLPHCLQKGIGIGRKQRANKESKKTCRTDQIYNPDTGRCVLKDGKIGREIMKKRK